MNPFTPINLPRTTVMVAEPIRIEILYGRGRGRRAWQSGVLDALFDLAEPHHGHAGPQLPQ
ncbi:hypothetical protein BN2475_120035 [Paraburkholderia ribeironis]|uniref:Uncharacterized protein n=1 Tax=Paraburkholderia ribeironis TaxID=1247936 RepID=A0A1N7RQU2_9BURK|nr:hypothetical protein BN2475_120035 [Paraburkholderia ribeironis]